MKRTLPRLPARALSIVLVAMVMLADSQARAQDTEAAESPSAVAVLDRLANDTLTPNAYSAAVKLHAKLHTFPFVSMTMRGTTNYQHPGVYKFKFSGFPLVARQFEKLNFDLGDPKAWPERYDVSLVRGDETTAIVRLTPKSSKIVRYIDLTVDSRKGQIRKAQWSRYDNGTLTLQQRYVAVGNNEMVSHLDAQVAIGAIRASLDVDFSDFVVPGSAEAVAATP